jgi:hypothetical protein
MTQEGLTIEEELAIEVLTNFKQEETAEKAKYPNFKFGNKRIKKKKGRINDRSILTNAAIKILTKYGPLHYKDITEQAQLTGLLFLSRAKQPEQSMNAALNTNTNVIFKRVDVGTYDLLE